MAEQTTTPALTGASLRRYQLRAALMESGFHRDSASRDHGDGCYTEVWTREGLGTVTLAWEPGALFEAAQAKAGTRRDLR